MNPLVREWVDKAEADYATVLRELRASKRPNFDAACFHSQQCAEKYLKAILQDAGTAIPKTHALETLLDLVKPTDPHFLSMRDRLRALSIMAVQIRYPGLSADKAAAKDSQKTCKELRERARSHLGLPKIR